MNTILTEYLQTASSEKRRFKNPYNSSANIYLFKAVTDIVDKVVAYNQS